MRINVTWDAIKRGEVGTTYRCPVANAIFWALLGRCEVLVFNTRIRVGGKLYRLPPEARDFVRRFDAGLPVEPFSFELLPVVRRGRRLLKV